MKPFLTVLAGPTASGKSALAIRLAKATGAEIVGADSQQVYRDFDIGTAKPSAAELAEVPHHLISVADPTQAFSAASYQQLADQAIAEISARGRRVVVVGGTGLYLRVLLHGLVDAPPADPKVRARLEAEAQAHGREALHQRLKQLDPEAAASIEPADRVRVVRALEIYELSGVRASEFRARHRFAEDRYPYELWVLSPDPEQLWAAIDQRTRAMFEGGLVQEVRSLLARGLREAPPMGSVGYSQALAVLEDRLTLEEAIADTAHKTRRYAKRQRTWFRKERGARWVSPPYEQVLAGR